MSQQVDSQTVNLNDGESASITLSWDTTNPDDIGDYIATAATEDDADTTSVTVENVTYHRFVEAVSPGGAASASRAGASDRSAVQLGQVLRPSPVRLLLAARWLRRLDEGQAPRPARA